VVVVGLMVLLRIAEDGWPAPGALSVLFVALLSVPVLGTYGRTLAARRAEETTARQGPLRVTVSKEGVRAQGTSVPGDGGCSAGRRSTGRCGGPSLPSGVLEGKQARLIRSLAACMDDGGRRR
jgi:hypothetical protein